MLAWRAAYLLIIAQNVTKCKLCFVKLMAEGLEPRRAYQINNPSQGWIIYLVGAEGLEPPTLCV